MPWCRPRWSVCYFVWFLLRSCLDLLYLRSGLDSIIGGLRRCEGHAAILSRLLEQVRQGTTICRLVPALLGPPTPRACWEPILVGIRPELAQVIVGLGLDLSSLTTQADLESGVRYAAQRQRRVVRRVERG
jgi:hypothetical protein